MRTAPDPTPGEGEIRIRVRAAGVNFADVLARLGLYPDAPKPPMVVGYEVVGHVDGIGRAVTGFSEGDRVFALTRFGGYADAVVVPAGHAFHVPESLSDAEAAAVPVNYLTAALALYRMAALNVGETVLVHNAGGGVGIAATQLARLRRATVIGTASAFKHDALRTFGVDHAIDYRHADVGRRDPQDYARPWRGRHPRSDRRPQLHDQLPHARAARAAGHLRPCRPPRLAERRSWWHALRAWTATPRFDPLSLINRNRGVFGLHIGHLWDEHRQLAPLIDLLLSELSAGRLTPVVARTFPLDRVADAHRFIQSRGNIGKVVLTSELIPTPPSMLIVRSLDSHDR